jgi:hypothetical protein
MMAAGDEQPMTATEGVMDDDLMPCGHHEDCLSVLGHCRACDLSHAYEAAHGPTCAAMPPDHEGDVVTTTVEAVATGNMTLVPLCERHRGAR